LTSLPPDPPSSWALTAPALSTATTAASAKVSNTFLTTPVCLRDIPFSTPREQRQQPRRSQIVPDPGVSCAGSLFDA
jgi:hypothetical protein